MKKIIITIILLLTLVGCDTQVSLNDLLEDVVFDAYESKVTFSMKSIGEVNSYTEFEYTVSDSNNYIKTMKTMNDIIEINVLYKINDVYYLYNSIDNVNSTIEVPESSAKKMYDQIISQRDGLYTNTETEVETYKKTSEDSLTVLSYTEVLNSIYYDTILKYNSSNNKFVYLEKKFTKNNTITTTKLEVSYVLDTTIPGGTI